MKELLEKLKAKASFVLFKLHIRLILLKASVRSKVKLVVRKVEQCFDALTGREEAQKLQTIDQVIQKLHSVHKKKVKKKVAKKASKKKVVKKSKSKNEK